ncbi:hypothetical protein [Hydrogenophaga sp.]|uniref:hypothetical protein n=1 Tax=Hydrogenophaga sp. TaxID=1904254 RepID=UPI0025C25BED|nr:hypothetical protein [Hydrogenophaga sp.]
MTARSRLLQRVLAQYCGEVMTSGDELNRVTMAEASAFGAMGRRPAQCIGMSLISLDAARQGSDKRSFRFDKHSDTLSARV